MRPITSRPLATLGLALAAAIAPTAMAGDQMYLPSYHIGSTPMPQVPGVNPGLAVGASTPAPPPTTGSGRPRAAARPRSTWPRLGPGGRAPAVEAPALVPHGRPAVLARPKSRPPVVPAGPTAGPTVASELSIVAAPPDYVPPSSRGVIARMTRGSEPEVPPGPRRGAPPVAMVPPEPLDHRTNLAGADGRPAPRPVDPLLAPVTTSLDAGRPTLTAGTAELNRAELDSRLPSRADDPLLAPRALVIDPVGVTAPPSAVGPLDPFAPAPPRRRPIPPLIARPADDPA